MLFLVDNLPDIEEIDGDDIAGKSPFGKLVFEFNSSGWVNVVKWSPSGKILAFAGHNSSLGFATLAGRPRVQQIQVPYLPIRSLLFLEERRLVAGGEHSFLMLFSLVNTRGEWALTSQVSPSFFSIISILKLYFVLQLDTDDWYIPIKPPRAITLFWRRCEEVIETIFTAKELFRQSAITYVYFSRCSSF